MVVELCVNVRLKAAFIEGIIASALVRASPSEVSLNTKVKTVVASVNMTFMDVHFAKCSSFMLTGLGKCTSVMFSEAMLQAILKVAVSQSNEAVIVSITIPLVSPSAYLACALLNVNAKSVMMAKVATANCFIEKFFTFCTLPFSFCIFSNLCFTDACG